MRIYYIGDYNALVEDLNITRQDIKAEKIEVTFLMKKEKYHPACKNGEAFQVLSCVPVAGDEMILDVYFYCCPENRRIGGIWRVNRRIIADRNTIILDVDPDITLAEAIENYLAQVCQSDGQ